MTVSKTRYLRGLIQENGIAQLIKAIHKFRRVNVLKIRLCNTISKIKRNYSHFFSLHEVFMGWSV